MTVHRTPTATLDTRSPTPSTKPTSPYPLPRKDPGRSSAAWLLWAVSTSAVEAPTATNSKERMGTALGEKAKAMQVAANRAMPATSTARRPIRSATAPAGYAATAFAALCAAYRRTAVADAETAVHPSADRIWVARRISSVAEKLPRPYRPTPARSDRKGPGAAAS